MSYDDWKTTNPLDGTEPDAEPGCECATGEHGTDCPDFEPPAACECFRLFTHDEGCPSYMGRSKGFP